MNGRVKFFNTSKGFGFIAGDDGKDYFVHATAVPAGTVLRDNDAVTFEVEMGDRGPKATKIALDKGDGGAAAPSEDESSDEGSEDEEQ